MIRGEYIQRECESGQKFDIKLEDDRDFLELMKRLKDLRNRVDTNFLLDEDAAAIGHVCIEYADPTLIADLDEIVSGPVLDKELHVIAESPTSIRAA